MAAALGGFAAAGAWSDSVGWWALLVALVLTWVSGLDYARVAPRLLRGTSQRDSGRVIQAAVTPAPLFTEHQSSNAAQARR